MSARIEKGAGSGRPLLAQRLKTENIIVDFDVERLKAPFLLRCGALLIDYIILVSIPVISILLARFTGEDGAKLLNSEINSAGWLIMVLLGVVNFVIFPLFSGQTIGKMFTGLRVVDQKGANPSVKSLLLRHFVGYPLTVLTGGLGFLIASFNDKGRSLNDMIAGTVVVYGCRLNKNASIDKTDK